MRVLGIVCLAIGLAGWCAAAAPAQEKSAERKAMEAELDQFRDKLFHAFNKGEYKEMLEKYCHKDVIATWQDGTTSKGHDEVLAEFAKLHTFIDTMVVDPNTDHRLILNDGKLVIATGNMKDKYALKRGNDVNLRSRWEATLVRDENGWVLVAFSASTNAFENEVVDLYLRRERYVSGGVAGGAGLVVGIVAGLLLARRRSA